MPEYPLAARPEACVRHVSYVDWSRLPFRERIVDQLAEVLLSADDILDMLAADTQATDLRWLEPNIQAVYDNVHTLLKSLCD
jgi:hypothetical protein